ncbi:hypothetical protein [Inhella proteolytica]|uniref:hypothetical protein n=1 Tax=Inhella proteolytica TaxID=2795029 RepID=UPI001E480EAE|nr:hypothetical protein [Inhella proteolytica]
MATLVAVVAAAVLFNPSPERHRTQIKQAVAERNQLAAMLRLGDVAAFVSSYHSLGVASYTTVNGRLLSVGALGVVVVLDSDRSP